ncbi:putative holin-like toxin [Clostridium botulinum]|nr:putative holin-like toxin [Clostridium botulinum]
MSNELTLLFNAGTFLLALLTFIVLLIKSIKK